MKKRSLIAKKKVDILLTKNSKTKEIYKKFEKTIFSNIRKKDFAVAVSGGADSLCLAYLSKIYSQKYKNKIYVVIVDHNLRKESHKEAIKVKNILKKKKIESTLLTWRGKVPQSNIQKNARNIRYSLINKFCAKEKLKYLVTAHHLDDQIENFFIRLLRGSGLTGLSSMSEKISHGDKIKIVRPFLNFKKIDLKYVTNSFFKTYIEDPSNSNEKFLRIRIRKYIKNMESEGLSSDKITKTINNLMSAKKALDFYKNKSLYKHVTFLKKNKCVINTKIFQDEAGEIIFKSFSDIFLLISGKYYPPRSRKILSLIERIKKNKFNKSTLGGCIIEKKNAFISVYKETKTKKASFQPSK